MSRVWVNAPQTSWSPVSETASVPPTSRQPSAMPSPRIRRRKWRSSVVVGLAGKDLVGAVELLEQHDPGELVGQGHRPEREPVVDGVEVGAERAADDEPADGADVGPERPADDDPDVAPVVAAALDPRADLLGALRLAVAGQQRHEGALR